MKRAAQPDPRPAAPATHPHDVFPATHKSWIQRKRELGEAGRAEINHHIMTIYAYPLKVYFQGTSDRNLGDPDDVVNGFFKDRLAKPAFFDDWSSSGLRLRRWLINAFCYFLLELRRQKRKLNKFKSLDERPIEPGVEEYRRVDNAYVVSLIRQAMAEAEQTCREKKLEAHWNVFVAHMLHGRSYAQLADEFKVTPGRAAVMNRTAEQRLKAAVRSLLERDGIDAEHIDDEIRALLEDSGS